MFTNCLAVLHDDSDRLINRYIVAVHVCSGKYTSRSVPPLLLNLGMVTHVSEVK